MKFSLVFFISFFIIGLAYVLMPGPKSVYEFAALENAQISDEPGDTWQVPNVKAYFLEHFRKSVMDFYQQDYFRNTSLPFTPFRLNYPPEFSYVAVRDQIMSTYLEELVYPLRGSLFINGYEPFYQLDCEIKNNCEAGINVWIKREPKFVSAKPILINGKIYSTKITIRYYPSDPWVRVMVWLGITVSLYFLWILSKRIILEKAKLE